MRIFELDRRHGARCQDASASFNRHASTVLQMMFPDTPRNPSKGVLTLLGRGVDIRELRARVGAGVAQLGQRRWDEVPVRNGSQVRILPPALLTINFNARQDESRAQFLIARW